MVPISPPMPVLEHPFSFDPTYGYQFEELLQIDSPTPPEDFTDYWRGRYEHVRSLAANPKLTPLEQPAPPAWNAFELEFATTNDIRIRGWALVPKDGAPKRGLIFGHGYGEVGGPVTNLPFFSDAVLFFPCLRGLGRSAHPSLPNTPDKHVIHGIEDRNHYVHGGCTEDVWMAVSAMIEAFPSVEGHIGYLGISFGGGIGMLSSAWEERIGRVHVNVPSFGNHPLRLTMKSHGSGEAVRRYVSRHSSQDVLGVLQYFDAATAAAHVRQPTHVAAALFDPFVTPAGQFSVYNALRAPKDLFVLEAGHFDYPEKEHQEKALRAELETFFAPL